MGHGLRFHLVAVATHVSQQVGPVDRGMSLDAKKFHRGTALAAFRTTTPFGPGRSLSGHVVVLGLDGCGRSTRKPRGFRQIHNCGPNASRFFQSREALSSLLDRSFARRAACSPLRAHSIPRYAGSVSEASHGPAFEVNESRFTATCQ